MKLSGKCLCGAVSFEGEGDGEFHACHCSQCRTWNGGPALGVPIREVAITGEHSLSAYTSSDWAERVFCRICGSHVFWRMRDGSMTIAFAAALDQADALRLTGEIYVDEQPKSYVFAGDHARLTGAEFIAMMTGEDGGA